SGSQAIFQAHHVFQAGGVFPDSTAPGAGQIAGMKRFQLQDQGELGSTQNLVLDDMPGNLSRERERETHRDFDSIRVKIRELALVDPKRRVLWTKPEFPLNVFEAE